MEDYMIVTNTTADLPQSYIDEFNLGLIFFTYTMDLVTYGRDNDLDYKEFYKKLREGKMASTSQVNPNELREYFERFLLKTNHILYLSFSSGLSGTYSNAKIVAEEMMEENPNCKILVVDSLCASLGEGLFVHKAVQLKKAGKSMEETASWMEDHILNFVHVFTVDDLNHLYRGGRVSKTAAILGTMINLKPILIVDNEGHLIPIGKVRGRKKSLHELVDYMEEKMGSYREQNDIIFISHGDAKEDGEFVAEEIKKRFGIECFLINHIGPTVGSHSGPGTIALFFLGEKR
ncbi:MAG TPA: DegV family protein [Lachnospiraceae bacterium]|nr:DegV family protein [Lachnospiraceae bacterium]